MLLEFLDRFPPLFPRGQVLAGMRNIVEEEIPAFSGMTAFVRMTEDAEIMMRQKHYNKFDNKETERFYFTGALKKYGNIYELFNKPIKP